MEATAETTQNLLVALGHPLRRQILRVMTGGPPLSPREVTERLDETLSNVSYHFRVLAESGVLRLVRTRPVRGSTQHFYGVTIDADWARTVLAIDESARAGAALEGEEIG
jgi:DNA-binding transcriptional ArsR family regulator